MNKREASLALMAKMTLADGQIDADERALLESLCAESGSTEIEQVLRWADEHSTETLAARITGYADRFFVALRAYMMATVDGEVHEVERQLFRQLIALFGIERPDQELIREQAVNMLAADPVEPPARIHELFARSSFAG